MRKLSKKISVLLVLAMLISMFGGVVSASAASSWSFPIVKADDADKVGEVVAVNGSIKLLTDEFIDFDLAKDNKVVTKKEYTVVWSSSDENVIWVDEKNGKARANKFFKAEVGDTAKVSATFTNVETKKSATRSFTVVLAEAESEYELVAKVGDAVLGDEVLAVGAEVAITTTLTKAGEAVEGATFEFVVGEKTYKGDDKFTAPEAGEYDVTVIAKLEGEEVASVDYTVVVAEPEFVSIAQSATNAVEIELGDAAYAKLATKDTIIAEQMIGDYGIAELVKEVTVKKDTTDVIVVTLYSNLVADKTYTFSYKGFEDCTASIKAAGLDPVKMTIEGGAVATGTDAKIKIQFWNATGIDVTTDDMVASTVLSTKNDELCYTGAGTVYFFEEGKTAVVDAVYDMGWDENGNKIDDLKASAEFTSVKAAQDSNLEGFAAAVSGKAAKDLKYGSSITIAMDDDTLYLYAKYSQKPFGKDKVDKYVYSSSTDDGYTYTYYSTNESIIMVGNDGKLYPASQGSASIYVKRGDNVVGSVAISVKGNKTLTTFTAKAVDVKVTANGTNTAQIAVTAQDQYGNDVSDVAYSYEIVNSKEAFAGFFTDATTTATDGKLSLKAVKRGNNKAETVIVKVTAKSGNVEKSQNVSFSIKNYDDMTIASTTLDLSAASVDMKLDKDDQTKYNVTIKLVDKDKEGFTMGAHNFNLITDEANAATGAGVYSVIVKQPDNKTVVNSASSDETSFVLSPVTVSGGEISKIKAGTYSVKLYKGNDSKAQLITNRTISVTDSTKAVTSKVVNANSAATAVALLDAIEFYRDGKKINDSISEITNVNITATYDNKSYVSNVKIKIMSEEMNNKFAGNFTIVEVPVNQLFINN